VSFGRPGQAPHRPTDPDAASFCRDWYELARGCAGNPLYEPGAKLYSLLFSKSKGWTGSSFERLVRRAPQPYKQYKIAYD